MSTIIRPDIIVQSPTGDPVAVVEVKNRQDLSRDIAVILHRTLLGYGYPARVPYFLLLSQDNGFLWHGPVAVGDDNAPAEEFDMRPVIARYLPNLDPADRLRGAELSLIVRQWLNDLAAGRQNETQEPERTLARAGFLAAIRDAVVTAEAWY
jgi:hypothetical protein